MMWENMALFNDDLVSEYMEWKIANPDNFTWWSYINVKSDLQTALGFAKFFYPEIIEVEGYFLLKDRFSQSLFDSWKKECNKDKSCIEKMMNLYQVRDFFHINSQDDEKEDNQIKVLGEILELFWSMSFKDRFLNKILEVSVFEESDGELFITVYEKV